MITIGLIGGVASGKSTVAQLLREKGAVVIDADKEAHQLYKSGTKGFVSIVSAFGDDIVGEDGEIDRKALGSLVFNNDQARVELNAIVWPIAREHIVSLKKAYEEERVEVVVLEAAMLLEAGCQDLVDEIWLVHASKEVRLDRFSARSGLGRAEGEARIRAQKEPGEYEGVLRNHTVVIIEADGTKEEVATHLQREWSEFLKRRNMSL